MNSLEFKKLAQKFNINLTEKMLKQFEIYYDFLVEYNNKINLTAITEKTEVYYKHFLDSMAGVNLINKNAKICDVGSGAGFPGVVLKIVRPDIKLVLVDSLNKRIVFLKKLTNKLGLEDVEAIHSRAEDFTKNNREGFDYVTARAVATLNLLSEYCLPLVKVGGKFIPYKAGDVEEELNKAKNAIKILGGKVLSVNKFVLPGTDITRSVVEIKKTSKTSLKYPRGNNKPKKHPL